MLFSLHALNLYRYGLVGEQGGHTDTCVKQKGCVCVFVCVYGWRSVFVKAPRRTITKL